MRFERNKMMSGWAARCALGFIAGSACVALAQTPAIQQASVVDARLPVYEVAVIKPDKSGSGSTHINTEDRTFRAQNVSLLQLVQMATGIKRDLISGMPSWTEGAHYDIDAKVLEMDPDLEKKGLSREQSQAMLRKLLEDRFGLKTHIETKTLAVYNLAIAKGGIKFKEYAVDASGKDKSGNMSTHGTDTGTEMTATGVPMRDLASVLGDQMHQTVIDKTGLAGKYDLHLLWRRDDAPPNPDGRDEAPGLFTALQEQLGLKLETGKGPVDTLVVDHIEPPTEN